MHEVTRACSAVTAAAAASTTARPPEIHYGPDMHDLKFRYVCEHKGSGRY